MSGKSSQHFTVQWVEPPQVDIPAEIVQIAGPYPLVAETLARRGMLTLPQARAFLSPADYQPSAPCELPDLDKAASRLEAAIRVGELIGVWGDFDVDGQTSTSLLVDVLRGLGGKVTYHIPVRERESHGVNLPNLKAFLDGGVQVVLTCDTGITAHEAAEYARTRGIDYIITDHHTLPPELPAAYAAVNPARLPENHPLRTLPGAGVAYKLAEELANRAGRPELAARQLDLVAMGIIADLALLHGDARYLAQLGLEALRDPQRVAIQAIIKEAGIQPGRISEETIGFFLAPRLNAVGRLDDANPMVDFLIGQDPARASVTATQLEALNAHRKLLTDQVFMAAQAQIEQDSTLLDSPVLVLAHPKWPAGVNGIVCSRLVELYYRPVILLTTPPGQPGRGSARSVEGINITAAITACQDLLLGFGGHPMAAGLSLETENLPELRRQLGKAVNEQLAGQELVEQLQIDAYLNLSEVDLTLCEQIDRLAPFGSGNPAPVLASRNLSLKNVSAIGKSGEHISLTVEDEHGRVQRVIWWQGAGLELPEGPFDLAYTLHPHSYNGRTEAQLTLRGMRLLQPRLIQLPSPDQVRITTDYRQDMDPRQALAALQQREPDLLVWQEGEHISPLPGLDRYHLRQAEALAIWSIPPSRAALERALETVSPRRVYLFGVSPAADQPAAFLQRLAGLLQHVLKHLGGEVSLARLSSATAQRELSVKKGLAWWQARGAIQLIYQPDGDLLVQEGSREPPPETGGETLAGLDNDLKYLLDETAAFRAYYLRASVDILIS